MLELIWVHLVGTFGSKWVENQVFPQEMEQRQIWAWRSTRVQTQVAE